MSFEFCEKAQSCFEKGCPIQSIISANAEVADEHREMVTHMAENLVGEEGEHIDRIIAEAVGDIAGSDGIEEMQRGIRISAANHINQIEDDISSFQTESDGHSLSCAGPLAMRAPANGGIFTVRICTLLKAYVNGSQVRGPANITRTSD